VSTPAIRRAERCASAILAALNDAELLEASDVTQLQRDLTTWLVDAGTPSARRVARWLSDHPAVDELLGTDDELDEVLEVAVARPQRREGARNPELEAAIWAAPDDEVARLVYGDWLASEGDPLGELIVAAAQSTTTARRARARLEAEHGAYLFGRLEEYRRLVRMETLVGLVDGATLARKTPLEMEWAVLLGWLLDAPVARFLRRLKVGVIAGRHSQHTELMDAITRRVGLGLHELVFETDPSPSSYRTQGGADVGLLPQIATALPELRSLVVRALRLSVGSLDHLRLERLELALGTTSSRLFERVGVARLPSLRALTLLATVSDPRARSTAFGPLLGGENAPRLEALGLALEPGLDVSLAEQLCGSRLVARLRTLDLSRGSLDAAALDLLARERRGGRLAHLASLALP
jgi:uncharacterized protein (TIGR02996 family)